MTRPASTAARARAGWGALLVSALARAALLVLTGLLLWSVAPVIAGWSSTVVMSDSMAPRLLTGDVVLVRPVEPDELQLDQILLVDDPDQPERLRLHRLTGIDLASGLLTLKGDANSRADSSPVHTDAVHGVAALRVPWIGSPVAWLEEGRIQLVAATAAALTVLTAGLVVYRPLPVPGAEARSRAPTVARASRVRGSTAIPTRPGVDPARSDPGAGDRTDTRPLPRLPAVPPAGFRAR